MKFKTGLALLALALAVTVAFAADGGGSTSSSNGNAAPPAAGAAAPAPMFPASPLFDRLTTQPDVVYLIANSSVVFGPDPHARSEEITFLGPVTVPKWPMAGYNRRILPDGRQQIDIELTQSELTGESYVLGGPVVLAEHPDLRSLGTITERSGAHLVNASAVQSQSKDSEPLMSLATSQDSGNGNNEQQKIIDENVKKLTAMLDKLNKPRLSASERKAQFKQIQSSVEEMIAALAKAEPSDAEVVPADFVVERKVLLTTAKGILYNETAVPVRGRIDSIPPVKFQGTPEGVNVFRGMELPVALLDRDGNVNGWFYSKAHMAYAVLPAGVERSTISGSIQLKSGDRTETVQVSGPAEIHHLTAPGSAEKTEAEFMMLALRGHSQLMGGDIMVSETFSDRDHFSRGQLKWNGTNADSKFDLFVDLYTPSAKLTTHDPLQVAGHFVDCKATGRLEKGKLSLPLIGGKGQFTANADSVLYDEAEKPVVKISKLQLNLSEHN
jgi:hypothetical protein